MHARTQRQWRQIALAVMTTAVVLMVGGVSRADNDPSRPDQACHFEGEDARWAKVDDGGLFGDAGNVAFDVPEDRTVSSWDMCPGCSLGVLAADFDIDVEELQLFGVPVDSLDSMAGITQALQNISGLSDTELAQLANDLQPQLGQSLSDIQTELARIRSKASQQLDQLSDLDMLATNIIMLGDQDLLALLDGLGFKHDSAYGHDFDNGNDRPIQNTGIKVWGVPEIVTEMTLRNVPQETREDIEMVLSQVPSLPGVIEISGHPDDPLSSVRFHGINTDLHFNYRSATISGNDVVLHHFTVVNQTPRVLPFFQAAFFADIDVPPGSTDLDLSYDPLTQTLMGYDELPQYDPIEHLAVGVAAASGGNSGLAPLNFHVDNKATLRNNSPGGELARTRFMLLDPSVIGDHDETPDGDKSDKFGAIGFALPGPLLPGAQHAFGICQASTRDTSQARALADTQVKLDACKALFLLLTPVCADGTFQFGEGCDDGNTNDGDGCSASCSLEICGDGRLSGAETCDDGNTNALDGCSEVCQREFCGDGVVQPGELCDDGNDSNFDACLADCSPNVCGDGFIKGGSYPLCSGRSRCVHGTLTVTGLIDPSQTDLQPLVGAQIPFGIGFDAPNDGTFFFSTSYAAVTFDADDPQHQALLAPIAQALANADGQAGLVFDGSMGDTVFVEVNLPGGGWLWDFALAPTNAEVDLATSVPVFDPPHTVTTSATLQASGTPNGVTMDVIAALVDSSLGAIPDAELCDDGNLNDLDACTSACEPARCGDGFVHVGLGEQCDEGENNGTWCAVNCTIDNVAACGDGTADPALGEACDDGNSVAGDGCSELCQLEVCGDAIQQASEACDDGGTLVGDGCSPTCELEFCGDGVVSTGETCDEGSANADDATCTSTCQVAICGDGLVIAGLEECDDGNGDTGDGCSSDCVVEFCGDGMVGAGEECDDGGTDAGDGCGATCLNESCGDGELGPGEACDDGNALDGDGCSKLCLLENPDACGDDIVGPGEQCDDGNTTPGDGCDSTCRLEQPGGCGNGTVDPGEQCDDGNHDPGDGCTRRCALEICGDGTLQPGEQCDDANTTADDGCTNCTLDASECGNGIQEYGEQCDGDDDCTADCTLETPPPGNVLYATCGNGMLDRGEECDDGDQFDGDGCGETCQLEPSICGNGRQERGEACDPADPTTAEGCTSDCRLESVCGDGQVGLGESCDDGNTDAGDGCSDLCKREFCGDGIRQANEECDEGGANGKAGSGCSTSCVPEDALTMDEDGDMEPLVNTRGSGCCTAIRTGSPDRRPLPLAALFGLGFGLFLLERRRR